jgi:hypothetical protein
MKPFIEFLRRNLMLILFCVLIIGQILIWRTLVSIRDNYDWYACGTRSIPCKVVVIPDH